MDYFPKALKTLIGVEGGYVDHNADSGGPTNHGVTEATARRHGYTGPMDEIPWEIIEHIYRTDYWNKANIPLITPIYPDLGYEVFEAGVLSGRGAAGEWLQRYLNLNNQRGTLYSDIAADGIVGPNTISALRAYARVRGDEGEYVALIGLNSLQGSFLMRLAERREKDEAFVYGWLKHRAAVDRPMTSPAPPSPSRREFSKLLCKHVSV